MQWMRILFWFPHHQEKETQEAAPQTLLKQKLRNPSECLVVARVFTQKIPHQLHVRSEYREPNVSKANDAPITPSTKMASRSKTTTEESEDVLTSSTKRTSRRSTLQANASEEAEIEQPRQTSQISKIEKEDPVPTPSRRRTSRTSATDTEQHTGLPRELREAARQIASPRHLLLKGFQGAKQL